MVGKVIRHACVGIQLWLCMHLRSSQSSQTYMKMMASVSLGSLCKPMPFCIESTNSSLSSMALLKDTMVSFNVNMNCARRAPISCRNETSALLSRMIPIVSSTVLDLRNLQTLYCRYSSKESNFDEAMTFQV